MDFLPFILAGGPENRLSQVYKLWFHGRSLLGHKVGKGNFPRWKVNQDRIIIISPVMIDNVVYHNYMNK